MAALFVVSGRVPTGQTTTTIKLASVVPDISIWANNLKQMSTEWSQQTGGRVVLTVFTGGSQGDESTVLRKMRLDALQGAALTGVGLGSIDASFNVFDVPFFFESYDELNAVIGLVRRANLDEPGPDASRQRIDQILARVQNELFNLGSLLATMPADLSPKQPRVEARHVEALEREIDELNEHLPPLRSFTLPGGGWVSSYLHLARTVCRRAERRTVTLAAHETIDGECVKYLNRLSDLLYVLGRWNVRQRGEQEPLWTPEKT